MNLQINKQLSTNRIATLNQFNRIRQTNKQRNSESHTTEIALENTKNTKKKNVPSEKNRKPEKNRTTPEKNQTCIGIANLQYRN
jgi:hypothetical protein